MNKFTHLTTGVIAGLIFIAIYNLSVFAYQCSEIRSDTIRLHVIANSDTNEDQEIKLKVRDAVLAVGQDIFNGTVNPENAQYKISGELKKLEEIANTTIKQNGRNYSAKAELVTEYFDTRTYNNQMTLPAGRYLALKIVLGEGAGQNWWCIMFPSLCLPAATKTNTEAIKSVYSEDEKSVVLRSDKYEIRFRIIEYLEKLKNNVDNIKMG